MQEITPDTIVVRTNIHAGHQAIAPLRELAQIANTLCWHELQATLRRGKIYESPHHWWRLPRTNEISACELGVAARYNKEVL